MIKYAGIILFSGAISMYGAHLSYKVREEIAVRKALYELLVHIKCCIDNGALPLDKIYSTFENALLEKTGFLHHLKSGETDALEKALTQSGVYIFPEIKELYLQLAKTVGKSGFRSAESERIARYMSMIQTAEAKTVKKDEARQELYKKLGILCGLLAALLLI